ncbi:unnamed protein product, partial [Discosporangium mesarthrocarpum]
RRWAELEERLKIRLRVRRNLRKALQSMGATFTLSKLETQQRQARQSRASRVSIQSAFKSFLARQTLGKRRAGAFLLRRRRAARALQCWTRGVFARRNLRVVNERRRVLHSTAVIMIQGQWRMFKALLEMHTVRKRKQYLSAMAIQSVVRGFVAKKKTGRRLEKARSLRKILAIYTLQGFVRCAQARHHASLLRRRRRRGACTLAALHVQRVGRGMLGRRRASNQKRLAHLDIWRAARDGSANRIDALYYGQGIGGGVFDHAQRDTEGNSLLTVLAKGGWLPLVRTYLKKGMDINAVNLRGESALRLAMLKRHLDVVDFLVTQPGIDLGQGKPGKSLLHAAAELGLHHLTQQLVSRGLDVNGKDPANGWSPLHYACHNSQAELARLLSSRSDIAVDAGGTGGRTALHLAAAAGAEKCVLNLLENQANPWIRDDNGQFPAITAMLHGHEAIAKRLLYANSKSSKHRGQPPGSETSARNTSVATASLSSIPDVTDPEGGAGSAAPVTGPVPGSGSSGPNEPGSMCPSVSIVRAQTSLDLANVVEKSGEEVPTASAEPTSGAEGEGAASGEARAEEAAQSPASDRSDRTNVPERLRVSQICSFVVRKNTPEHLKETESGKDTLGDETLVDLVPTRWDDKNIRAAISLAERGKAWCLSTLFATGLEPHCSHPETGDTLGIAAARGGDRNTLNACLEAGVDFISTNKAGRTALHVACTKDSVEVAALLLVNPGLSGLEVEDLCAPDNNGRTPLHEVVASGCSPSVLLLAAEPESDLSTVMSTDSGSDSNSGASGRSRGSNGGGSGSNTEITGTRGNSNEETTDTGSDQPAGNARAADCGKGDSSTPDAGVEIGVNPDAAADSSGLPAEPALSGLNAKADDSHQAIVRSPRKVLATGPEIRMEAGYLAEPDDSLGSGSKDKTMLLLGELLNVNARCVERGRTPLHEAAAVGSISGVLSLLQLGGDPGLLDADGNTALHVAVGEEPPLDPGDEARTEGGENTHGNEGIGSVTQVTKVSLGIRTRRITHYFCRFRTINVQKIVNALLRHGADPTARGAGGRIAAAFAVESGRAGALREVRKHVNSRFLCGEKEPSKAELSDLEHLAVIAVTEGRVGCLRALTIGCDAEDIIAWRDDRGGPLVALAMATGELECVEHMVGLGAQVSFPCDPSLNTVLHLAASIGNVRLLRRLMSKAFGGQTNHTTPTLWSHLRWLSLPRSGDTVLMAAMRAGNMPTARHIIRVGGSVSHAAHEFRYAWLIATAIRAEELCPCSLCVFGRSADERLHFC